MPDIPGEQSAIWLQATKFRLAPCDGAHELATGRPAFDVDIRTGVGVSLSDLINPFTKLEGTVSQPKITVDKKGTLLERGAAIATCELTVLARGLKNRLTADADESAKR